MMNNEAYQNDIDEDKNLFNHNGFKDEQSNDFDFESECHTTDTVSFEPVKNVTSPRENLPFQSSLEGSCSSSLNSRAEINEDNNDSPLDEEIIAHARCNTKWWNDYRTNDVVWAKWGKWD
ncbi:hypothetical protein TKK_0016047 [Trichogramma kaykai]